MRGVCNCLSSCDCRLLFDAYNVHRIFILHWARSPYPILGECFLHCFHASLVLSYREFSIEWEAPRNLEGSWRKLSKTLQDLRKIIKDAWRQSLRITRNLKDAWRCFSNLEEELEEFAWILKSLQRFCRILEEADTDLMGFLSRTNSQSSSIKHWGCKT